MTKNTFVFAKRTDWNLEENEIVQALAQAKKKFKDVIDLTLSNPTRCNFDYSAIDLNCLSHEKAYSYKPQAQGMHEAREAVVEYYQRQGFSVDLDDIFLTASTSEAYNYVFRLLCNPEDVVLFPSPSYPLFSFLTDLADVEMKLYSLHYIDKWQIDFDSLREKITDKVKALCLVNPNNPTSSYVKRKEYDSLRQIANENSMPIISDEVFWDYFLDNNQGVSLLEREDGLNFILGGLSKTLGLSQMKLSWIIIKGEDSLVNQAKQKLDVIADTYLSVNTPVQVALKSWLEQSDVIQKSIRKRISENYFYLKESIQNESLQLLSSEGGWYAILRLPDSLVEDQFVLKLLNDCGVYAHPGFFYDIDDMNCVVISLLPIGSQFQKGIESIKTLIKAIV